MALLHDRVRAAAERDPQRGDARALRRRRPSPRPPPLRGPLVRRPGADAARLAAALGLARRSPARSTIELRRGDDYTILDTRGEARHLRPGAALDGAERHRLHGRRPHRPARGAGERHRRLAADARDASAAAPTSATPIRWSSAATLWADASARSRPRCGRSCAATTSSSCRTTSRQSRLHARRLHAAGLLDDDELAETLTRARRDHRSTSSRSRRGRALRDRAAARRGRPQDPRRPLAQRPGRGRLPPLRRRTRATEADERAARRSPARSSTAPRRRQRRRCPGYTHLQRAIPVTRRPPPARLGRDARARPRPLRVRRRPGRGRRRSAPARSPARRCRCRRRPTPMRNTIDAVADRDFALDYLYACAVLFSHLSRIGEELVLWTTAEFGFARLPEDGRHGLVDDAAEAQPRRRRARARQGGHRDRAPHGPARDAEGRCRSPTTATCRRTSRRSSPRGRDVRGALARADGARPRPRVRPRPARRRVRRPAPARDRRRRGARPRGRPVPRRARAGRRLRARRDVRGARRLRRGSATWRGRGRRRRERDGREAARGLARGPRPDCGSATSSPAEIEAILDLAAALKLDPQPLTPARLARPPLRASRRRARGSRSPSR